MSRKQWKAGVIVALSLAFVAWTFLPARAGPSTKGNLNDRANEDTSLSIYVDDGAWTTDVSAHRLAGGIYQSVPQTVTDGRTAPFQVDVNGNIITSSGANNVLATKTLIRAEFDGNPATGAYQEIIAANAGDQYFIVELSITQDTQNKMELVADSASGETGLWTGYVPAYGGILFDMSEQPHFVVTDEKNLAVQNNTGGSINMAGHVIYYVE